jgi:hypothetical protein
MSEWPDALAVRAFLAHAARRLRWIAVMRGGTAGLAVALGLTVIAQLSGWTGRTPLFPALVAVSAFGIGALAALRRLRPVAHLVELRAPCQNVVITAAELIERPARVRAFIGERVCRDAARKLAVLDPRALFPARPAVLSLTVLATAWIVSTTILAAVPAATVAQPGSDALRASAIDGIALTITPPSYAGRTSLTLQDPAHVEALAGSRIQLSVRSNAAIITVQTIDGRQTLGLSADHAFTGELTAVADGYISIEPAAADGTAGARRLIGLSVEPDAAPHIRITVPGRDLMFDDAERSVALRIEADDDIALASLGLRYTRVSGSGEQFTFTEGEIPVDITRTDDRHWIARGTLPLATLVPSPGDMLVYRGVATDARPGAPPTESDAFIVEIRSPGSIAAEGFAIDDEQDRYAISQQMVILQTERLAARAASLPADSLAAEAGTIAAAQRTVRAEFVFMMGGELAEEVLAAASMEDLNEEAHAEADDEAIAGRLANQGRTALLQAIRAMSRANTALIAADLRTALTQEKAALANLQRAFSRTRYILRALTERERIDFSRRLTGALGAAGRSRQPVPLPESDTRTRMLRESAAGIARLAGDPLMGPEAARRLAALADQMLRQDPSTEAVRQIASRLYEAAAAVGASQNAQARELLDQVASQLTAALRAGLPDAPARPHSLGVARLQGALIDAARRPAGSR